MKRTILLFALLAVELRAQNPQSPKWPTPATDNDLMVATNLSRATLNGAINSSVTTITVNTSALVTPGAFTFDDSAEVVKCLNSTSTQLSNCTRGAENTTATSHSSGVTVHNTPTAAYFNQDKAEIKAVESDLDAQTKLSTVTFNASTMVFDWSTSSGKKVTLTAAVTAFTATNPVSGRYYTTQFCQDATGGWAVTFPAAFKNAYVSPTASVCTLQTFYYDGTNYNGGAATSNDTPSFWYGPTRSACATPTVSTDLCIWFDSGDKTVKGKDSSANVFSMVRTASSGTSNQVVDYLASTGLLHYRALAIADLPTVTNAKGGTGQDSSGSTGVAQVSGGTWSFSTALANGTSATTQSSGSNDTKVATDAYADAVTPTVAHGGTGQTSYTKGDLLCPSGSTTITKLAVGSNTQVLTADSTQACGIKWAAAAGSSTVTENVWVPFAGAYNGGGTGVNLIGVPSGSSAALPSTINGTTFAYPVLEFDHAAQEENAYWTTRLHDNWTGAVNITISTIPGSGSAANAYWKLYTVCIAEGTTTQPTYNAAQTQTVAYSGTSNTLVTVTFSSVTMTGCSAGQTLSVKIGRDGTNGADTFTGAINAIGMMFKYQHT